MKIQSIKIQVQPGKSLQMTVNEDGSLATSIILGRGFEEYVSWAATTWEAPEQTLKISRMLVGDFFNPTSENIIRIRTCLEILSNETQG